MNFISKLKGFSKFFDYREEPLKEEPKVLSYTDPSQICLVQFKSKGMAKTFAHIFDVDQETENVPNPKIEFTAKAMFPVDFLKDILNSFPDNYVVLEMKTNSPIKISGRTFTWYLAPRMPDQTEIDSVASDKEVD